MYAKIDIRRPTSLYYGIPLPRVGTFDTGLNAVVLYVVFISTSLVPIHCDYVKFRLLFTNLEVTFHYVIYTDVISMIRYE